MFQQNNAPCDKIRVVLELFQERDVDFQLIFWPPNSQDFNAIERIWDVMERQLRVKTPPSSNILDYYQTIRKKLFSREIIVI